VPGTKGGGEVPEHLNGQFEDHALFQVRLLAQRVETLGKEKEELEVENRNLDKRIRKIEHDLPVGWGILVIVPILGAFVGFLFANGKMIFKPWLSGG
jgi:hypothetical protein